MAALSIPLNAQAQAIKAACQQYGVPVQVFIGMYEQETALGTNVTNSSAGAIGPFQFEPGTAGQYGYPLTNSPSLSQFQAQANAAAHLLSDGFKQFHSWRDSLAAYNAGAGNIGAGMGYAARALAFGIPGNWLTALNAAPGGPVRGGIAGAGGTGTTPNAATKSGFAIGSTDNPDEDIWTGVNRLAQEVQWYLFSDGETVYYADGADLIAQDPGSNATVDRVKDSARIAAFEATLDNTAYEKQSNHKRKGKVQHKTRLSKIQSPTQVRLDLICGIDEFRAGDLIVLAGYGALNGRWLISDVTRSVFEVKSQLTLVPPVAPLTEAEVQSAGTTGTAGAANSPPSGRGSRASGGFANPFPGGWQPSRLDMGFDGMVGGGRICSPVNGQVVFAGGAGNWHFYVAVRADGAIPGLATRTFYFAEGLQPTVNAGQHVSAGQVIATTIASPWNGIVGNIEWGLAIDSSGVGSYPPPAGGAGNVLAFARWCQTVLRLAGPTSTDHAGAF